MVVQRPNIRLLAEILSAIAVVMSLVFVGLEVRESARQTAMNTQSIQVSAYQQLIGQINALNLSAIQSPEVAEMFSMLEPGPRYDSLSAAERVEIYTSDALLFLLFRHGDMAFYQYELGMLPEERLDSAMRPLTCRLTSPVVLDFWAATKENFSSGYRGYVDDHIERGTIC